MLFQNRYKIEKMKVQEEIQDSLEDDFNITQFFGVIWGGRNLIVAVSVFFSLLVAVISLNTNNYYSSEALLVPTTKDGSSSSGVSGLASMAGINLGSGSPNKTKEAMAVLKSRKFIVDLMEKYDLMIPILASKSWDPKSKQLMIDQSIYSSIDGKWKKEMNISDAYRKFSSRHYSVSSDIKGSGLVTIKVEFISPELTKLWVDLIIKEVNAGFKNKEIREASRSLDYLSMELKKPNINLDQKTVLYSLIQEQTNILVLANGKDEFMFKTIDPAYISDRKAGPVRSVFVVLAFFVGTAISIFSLFIAFYNNAQVIVTLRFPWIKINRF